MSDIKLFRLGDDGVCELEGRSMALEKSLQTLMERSLETLLGVRFLASEYSTGVKRRGRIDTLGLDENGCPVIIEYKRASNENVIEGFTRDVSTIGHLGAGDLEITIRNTQDLERAKPFLEQSYQAN